MRLEDNYTSFLFCLYYSNASGLSVYKNLYSSKIQERKCSASGTAHGSAVTERCTSPAYVDIDIPMGIPPGGSGVKDCWTCTARPCQWIRRDGPRVVQTQKATLGWARCQSDVAHDAGSRDETSWLPTRLQNTAGVVCCTGYKESCTWASRCAAVMVKSLGTEAKKAPNRCPTVWPFFSRPPSG